MTTGKYSASGLYRVFMTLLVNGNQEFCNVSDELIALCLPQHVHTQLQMLDQNLLKMRGGRHNYRGFNDYHNSTD